MGVQTRNLITRRKYSFTKAKTNSTTTIVVHRSVAVNYGETAELIVRVHEHDNPVASNKIEVVATPISLTSEEPDVDFLTSTAAATVNLAQVTEGTLLLDSFTEPFGNAFQLTVEGTKGGTDDTLEATISVDLIMRD